MKSADFLSFESAGSVLLARVGSGGLFRSLDDGDSWSSANTGLSNPNVSALHTRDSTVFAGTKGGGIFRSQDAGRSWADVNVGISNFFVRLVFTDNDSVFALTDGGLFRSSDNGSSWILTSAGIGLPEDAPFTSARIGSGLFAVNGTRGLFRSRDNGRSWTDINKGISGPGFRILVNSNGPGLFALTYDGRTFRSQDTGSLWSPVDVEKLPEVGIASFAVAGSEFFVGTHDSGIYRNKNGIKSWERSYPYVRAHALHVSDSLLLAGTNNGLLRSGNLGDAWSYAGNGAPPITTVSFSSHGPYSFAASGSAGIYRSRDRGVSWAAANAGLPGLGVFSLAAGEDDVFAGTDSGVFRSRDTGSSWSPANDGISNRRILSLARWNNDVFAGTSDDGVYRSRDFGVSWTRFNDGMAGTCIHSLFIRDSMLFAGVAGTGHWKVRLSGLSASARPHSRFSMDLRTGRFLRFGDPIRFSSAGGGRVRIDVFDYRGQLAGTLLNGSLPSGMHEVPLHFKGSPGLYFLRLEAGNARVTRGFVLDR